jgi:hypothetical protein
MKNLGLAKRHGSILVIGDDNPSHPEDFERKLQAYDKDLIIAWHRPDHWKKRRRPGVPGRSSSAYAIWRIPIDGGRSTPTFAIAST